VKSAFRITRGAVALLGPQLKQQRAFKNKGLSILGLSNTVQHSFQSILRQHEAEIFFSLAGEIQEPLPNRRRHVDDRLIQRSDFR
jgi:hypothetical protein